MVAMKTMPFGALKPLYLLTTAGNLAAVVAMKTMPFGALKL